MTVALGKLGLVDDSCEMLRRAGEWLKKRDREGEWFLRVPALLAAGQKDWVDTNGDSSAIRDILAKGQVGPLFFAVAVAASLLEYGYDIPNANELRASAYRALRDEGPGLVSFDGITSTTALYATFLNRLAREEDTDVVQKAFAWLIVRKIESRADPSISWENSYGRTAYVLIDLWRNAIHGLRLMSPLARFHIFGPMRWARFQWTAFQRTRADQVRTLQSCLFVSGLHCLPRLQLI
jgi:hypothetical protein